MKLDIHTHWMPSELPRWKDRFGYGGFICLEHAGDCRARMLRDDGKVFREVESNCWDPERRVRECAETGVTAQVVSVVPALFAYHARPRDGLDVARFLNDGLAMCVGSKPKSFLGLATLPMQDPELAACELERSVTELGLVGAQIGSHVGEHNLSDRRFDEVWAVAERASAAVFVHPWDMMGETQMSRYWLPWLVGMPAETSLAICSMIFGGVFERFPKLRVAFAHCGGSFTGTFGRVQHGYEVRPDLCAVDNPHPPKKYLGRFWVDSLAHEPEMLLRAIELYGRDRVALGSDYPFPLGEARPGELIEREPRLPADLKRRLLWDNGLEWALGDRDRAREWGK